MQSCREKIQQSGTQCVGNTRKQTSGQAVRPIGVTNWFPFQGIWSQAAGAVHSHVAYIIKPLSVSLFRPRAPLLRHGHFVVRSWAYNLARSLHLLPGVRHNRRSSWRSSVTAWTNFGQPAKHHAPRRGILVPRADWAHQTPGRLKAATSGS